LKQAKDGTVAFIQRCVNQLGGSPGPQQNAQPLRDGARYVERARTAEEIKATPAANEGHVSRAPARYRNDDDVDTVAGRGELADPVQQPAQPPQRRIITPDSKGWSL
jgi:hypothetical protein